VSGVVVRPDGGATVAWVEFPPVEPTPFRLFLRGFSLADEPLSDPFAIKHPVNAGCCSAGPLAGNAAGNVVLGFSSWRPNVLRYGFSDGPQGLKLDASRGSFATALTGIALDARGDFVAVWQSRRQEPQDRADVGQGVYGRLVDSHGVPVGPEIHVNTIRQGNQSFPRVSMAAPTGAFVVVWETNPTGNRAQVAGQLFAPGGARIGGEFRVGAVVQGAWLPWPEVAMAPDGSFMVVWQEPDDQGIVRVLGQLFSAKGLTIGPTFRIGENVHWDQLYPLIASDPHGNFVVTWENGLTGATMARLYRANGTPVRTPVTLTKNGGIGLVAFGWNGTFAVAWTEMYPAPVAYVRRFSASPGEEICFFRNATPLREAELECDTGRTGDLPEIRHPLRGKAGDIGLLGDIDGDGRADPCVFRSGVFLCDTEHDSGTTGVTVGFGQAGDLPFLADVDGDGRADPCVYRDGHFLCDTHHDGVGNVDIPFGAAGDPALLGDFDGDGRADPCVYVHGTLLCDTAHGGGSPEGRLHLGFGDPGSVPMLGNLDGL
jgi:hypothetical protein